MKHKAKIPEEKLRRIRYFKHRGIELIYGMSHEKPISVSYPPAEKYQETQLVKVKFSDITKAEFDSVRVRGGARPGSGRAKKNTISFSIRVPANVAGRVRERFPRTLSHRINEFLYKLAFTPSKR